MGAGDPYDLKGLLKRLGGSQSDHWNKVLIDQTVHTLGLNRSDGEARERRHRAALAGLIGIGPQDEMEGMIAAQLRHRGKGQQRVTVEHVHVHAGGQADAISTNGIRYRRLEKLRSGRTFY